MYTKMVVPIFKGFGKYTVILVKKQKIVCQSVKESAVYCPFKQ